MFTNTNYYRYCRAQSVVDMSGLTFSPKRSFKTQLEQETKQQVCSSWLSALNVIDKESVVNDRRFMSFYK